MAEYLLKDVDPSSVDVASAMEQNPVSITGVAVAMGVDGFLQKQLEMADWYREIEHILTDEQQEVIEEFKNN